MECSEAVLSNMFEIKGFFFFGFYIVTYVQDTASKVNGKSILLTLYAMLLG